jgi:hypothetical protein
MTAEPAKPGLNPAALRPADAAQALGISEDMIAEDLAAGAPANADGTINLVHYAAWLNQEMGKTDGP